MSDTSAPRGLTRDELNRRLWRAADILRGTVDAGDFKNHILALLFLKRLSDVFYERRDEIVAEWMGHGKTRAEAEKIAEDPDEYGGGSYYIPAGARWDDLQRVGENRAEALDKALYAIEDTNSQYLEGVLGGIHFNDERRFGDPKAMDALMQRLLAHFGNIPLGNRSLADPDVLGNAYEYLIERFAESSGKKGGEFYTPREVVRLIVRLLDPAEGMRIHDPTCGSGGMLIECGKYVREHGGNPRNLTLTGQEKNYGTWAICKLNMLLHNVPDADIRPGDTIASPRFERAGVLDVFDRVIANPPFSLKEWHGIAPAAGKTGDDADDEAKVDAKQVREKFQNDTYHRFTRGVPPATKGDMAFLQHMVAVCKDSGMVGVVMPHGVLFRGGAEADIRQALLQEDLVEAVIGLPEKLFFGTGIPAAVVILNKRKPAARRRQVLFIDASSDGLFREGKNRNYLRDEDLLRVAAVFHAWAAPKGIAAWLDRAVKAHPDFAPAATAVRAWLAAPSPSGRTALDKFAAVVTLDTIAQDNDYNLNISRYVDATEPPPQLDVAAELRKLRDLEAQRNAAEATMDELLKELGYGT